MWSNYFKVTIRNIFRQKGYSFINIFGLAIGIAISLLIFLYVQDEISYDRYHEDANCIYRLEMWSLYEGEENHWAASQGNLVPLITDKYPEVKSACKILFTFNSATVQYEDNIYNETQILNADSTFFDIFTHKAIDGSLNSVLSGPDNIVLTKSTAKKYFGNESPIGEMMKINNTSFKVAAVIEDVPGNSHFHFDIVVPLDFFRARNPRIDEGGPYAYYSYIKTSSPEQYEGLQQKINEDVWELLGYTVTGDSANIPTDFEARIPMMPVTGIHLNGHAEKEIEANSDKSYIYIFSIIAIFILIIACINYMNLATAKSFRRGKEVGVRKVLGAYRSNIVKQFLSESTLIALISVILAVIMVELVLPPFNTFTGKELEFSFLSNLPLSLLLLGILLLTGFLSGSYPSFILSSFSPIKVLKSNTPSGANKTSLYLRRGLVVFQFGISVLLIVVTITIYNQLNFIQSKKLGFDKENVLVLRMPGNNMDKMEVLKNELLKQANVQSVSSSSVIPGERVHFLTVRLPDLVEQNNESGEDNENVTVMRVMSSDVDVVETFGLEVKEGRAFSRDFATDPDAAFLLNEAAVEEFGLENPVGTRFEYLYGLREPKTGQVVGVLKDFHYASLHNEVEPVMIHIMPQFNRNICVKLKGGNVKRSVSEVEEAWMSVFPSLPFNYRFLDTTYDNMYKAEMNMGKLVLYFTLLAIFIACLGLLGLASHVAEQKTKEIGIRKVLGASIGSIISSLSKEFVILIVLANLLAIIPAVLYLNQWLDSFAFRISLGIWVFIITGVASLLIAFITVSTQTMKAAHTNPVKALKYE